LLGVDDEYFEIYGYPLFYADIREYWGAEMDNHDLLMRIDERTRNIWRSVEKLEKHQLEANGYIKENIKQTANNTAWISAMRWVIGLLAAGVITWLTHLQGLW